MGDLIQRIEFHDGIVVLLDLELITSNFGDRYHLKSVRMQISGEEYVLWEQDDRVEEMDENNNVVGGEDGGPSGGGGLDGGDVVMKMETYHDNRMDVAALQQTLQDPSVKTRGGSPRMKTASASFPNWLMMSGCGRCTWVYDAGSRLGCGV